MIFTKVNESYDGFEVAEEGWMRTVGLYLVAGGLTGMILSPIGLLTGGLTGAGVTVGASTAALLSGWGLLRLDEKLDQNKLLDILNKCPDLLKYFKKFAIDYKKKNPKCFLLLKEAERITTDIDSFKCDVLTGNGNDDVVIELEFDNLYTLAFLCDDKLKEIKRICLLVAYVNTHGDERSYYYKYITIPQPPKSVLNKLEIQVKNKMKK